MGISEDIYNLQRFAAAIGTSKIAVELGRELVNQLKRAKATNGPSDYTGTLSKGIFAISQPEGGVGNWSIGVGDKNVLGDPSEKAPKGTIADFLGLIRQGYRAQRQRVRQRKLATIEERARIKAGIHRTLAEQQAQLAEHKRLQRAIRREVQPFERKIGRAEARVAGEVSKLASYRAATVRQLQNIASQRTKLEKRIAAFAKRYNVVIPISGSGEKRLLILRGFLDVYGSISGKTREIVGYRSSRTLGREHEVVPIYSKINKKQQIEASRLRSSIRTNIRKFSELNLRRRQIRSIIETVTEKLDDLRQSRADALRSARKPSKKQRR